MRQIDSTGWTFGPYCIERDERVLRFDGRPVPLAPKVVETLVPFFETPGRVIAKPELMERIWPDGFVEEANLTQNVYVLRKLFERHQSGIAIENVPKRGYRLVSTAAVAPLAATCAPASKARPRRALPALAAVVVAAAVIATIVAFSVRGGQHTATAYQLPARALQAYLLGQYDLRRGTPADLRAAAAEFGALVREAPDSALGYAGLAEAKTSETFFAGSETERLRLGADAVALAHRALAVDAGAAEAYTAAGAVETSIEHDDAAAAGDFREALRRDPHDLDALLWYGGELMNEGDPMRARALFRRALADDPAVPGAVASLAWSDFLLRDFGEAAALSQQLIRSRHLEQIAHLTLASADVQRRDYDEALREVGVLERTPETRTQAIAMRSQIDALRGSRALALRTLRRLDAATNADAIGPWDVLALAAAYARLGRRDEAYAWLDRVRATERPQLARDPRFDPLRDDPRFRSWLSG